MDDKKQKEVFSRNLINLMKKKGKSQTEVARDLGIALTTYNNWISGISIPKVSKLQKLADYFGVGKSALVDECSEPTPFTLTEQDEKYIIEWYRDASVPEREMLKRIIGMAGDMNGKV